jgi:hypothetical protein
LLDHGGSLAQSATWGDVAEAQLYEVTTAELCINGAVEQRQIPDPIGALELLANAPDMFWLKRRFCADDPPRIPWALGLKE